MMWGLFRRHRRADELQANARTQRACQGADFSRAMAHLEQGINEHADRDGLTGVRRAVFIDRGGHAPGQVCPSEPPQDPHFYICEWPDDECTCHLYGHDPERSQHEYPGGDTP